MRFCGDNDESCFQISTVEQKISNLQHKRITAPRWGWTGEIVVREHAMRFHGADQKHLFSRVRKIMLFVVPVPPAVLAAGLAGHHAAANKFVKSETKT